MKNNTNTNDKLKNMPISLFSIVMGMIGLAIAWKKAHITLGAPSELWVSIAGLGSLFFIIIALFYLLKFIKYKEEVFSEWNNPIKINFFPTISISLLLQSAVWMEDFHSLSYILWISGTIIQFGFSLAIMSSWINHSHYEIKHLKPVWFIPIAGNLLVPIAGIHFAPLEVSWFFFSVGLVFWFLLLAMLFYRLFFHDPLSPKLLPTMLILLAPPAIAFVSYIGMTQTLDNFSRIIYYFGLFMTILLAFNVSKFVKNKFYLSSWAYSFPIAAMSIATFVMANKSGLYLFNWLAVSMLVVVSSIVAILIIKTLIAIRYREICQAEYK